jgi:hypothetical protein
VAIHDAVNAVEPRYEPYQPRTSPAPAGASVEAAIAGAAHDTLVAFCLSGCFSKPPHVGVQSSAGSSEWPLRLE